MEAREIEEGNHTDNPQPAQEDVKRPVFSEHVETAELCDTSNTVEPVLTELRKLMGVKHTLNTIQEGINLAKGSKVLPPYMSVDFNFTPRMVEHSTKDQIKEQVRELQGAVKTYVLSNLSEILAKNVREVGKEMDQKLQEADVELQTSSKFEERRELFRKSNEMIHEYKEKLAVYKEGLARKPGVLKPKYKAKKRY